MADEQTITATSLNIDHFYNVWFGMYKGKTISQVALENYPHLLKLKNDLKSRPNAIQTIDGLILLLNNYTSIKSCEGQNCDKPANYIGLKRETDGSGIAMPYDLTYCAEHKMYLPQGFSAAPIKHSILLDIAKHYGGSTDKRIAQRVLNYLAGFKSTGGNITKEQAADFTLSLEKKYEARMQKPV